MVSLTPESRSGEIELLRDCLFPVNGFPERTSLYTKPDLQSREPIVVNPHPPAPATAPGRQHAHRFVTVPRS
jgi:hypothetical protein